MREWLVIENSGKHSPWFDGQPVMGYIPRDIVEGELGIKVEPDGRCTFFTAKQGEAMRAHPAWRENEPA